MAQDPPRPDRIGSFAYIGVVYVLAIVAALLFFQVDAHPMVAMGIGLLAATAVTYAATLYLDNGSVFDPWWSVLPPFVALFFTGLSEQPHLTARQAAVHAVVWFWGVRLTFNWARGWPGLEHEDWRYRDLYASGLLPRWAVRLLAVELFPTLIVAVGCISLYPALALGGPGFNLLDVLALTVGVGATAIELAADEQLHSFARTKQPGQLLDWGLWRYSRHPNYFGEIGFWVSLWLFGLSAAPAYWWTAIGPVAMICMFVFASIPMLDRRSAERRPGFEAYARRTSALIPRPPREGAAS